MSEKMNDLKLEPLALLLPRMLNGSHGDIYLQGDYPWNADSLGLLFYSEGYDIDPLETEFPDFKASNRLQYVMQTGRAEDALRNAYMQKELMHKPELSIAEAVSCFNFH